MRLIALVIGLAMVAALPPHAAPPARADDFSPPKAAEVAGPPEPGISPCVAHADKSAAPAQVVLGEQVRVTLDLRVECPGEPVLLDAVLVLDRSSSMTGQPMVDARGAAARFVDLVDMDRARVGVVSFARTARTDLRLIDDRERLHGAIARIEAEGSTSISDGLREAARALASASPRPGAVQAVILLTDGLDMLGPDAVRNQAAEVRGQGAHLVTIALGLRADAHLLSEIASTPADAYVAPDSADLLGIYTRLAGRLARVEARDVVVSDELPDDMRLEPGTLLPSADVDEGTITWRLPLLPPDGARLTYLVRPALAGYRPTNVTADAAYIDSESRPGHAIFPVPYVTVHVEPPPTPGTPSTPTPETSGTPTGGTAPTATAMPTTPTDAPPGGPTAPPGPTWPGPKTTAPPEFDHIAFLPVVGSICRLAVSPADVVLLIDSSTTMLGPTESGRSKLEAAVDAMGSFADRLDLTEHRVAVVGFDDSARTLVGLTSDRAALDRALGVVEARPGSRIDLGLAHAAALLEADARSGARPAVVLLSDGRPAGASAELVRLEAQRLREGGAMVFAIAIGADADRDLMRDIAAIPERYVDAGDGERLDAVYEVIAGQLVCR